MTVEHAGERQPMGDPNPWLRRDGYAVANLAREIEDGQRASGREAATMPRHFLPAHQRASETLTGTESMERHREALQALPDPNHDRLAAAALARSMATNISGSSTVSNRRAELPYAPVGAVRDAAGRLVFNWERVAEGDP